MANPDFSLFEPFQRREAGPRGLAIDGGGSGGDDGGMEARIVALETATIGTRDRLARIETRLDSVATRENLHREINAQTWRLVTFVCSFGTALVAATYFIANQFY